MAKHIVTVATEKGGAGKTTTLLNLSVFLSMQGKRVLVVDSCPQGNATSNLTGNREKEHYNDQALYDLVRYGDLDAAFRRRFIHETQYENIDIIPSSLMTADVLQIYESSGRAKNEASYRYLKHCLREITDEYDYVFIDTPPTLNDIVVAALYAATDVVIPMYYNSDYEIGMTRIISVIEELRETEGAAPEIAAIVFGRIERTNQARGYLEAYQDEGWRDLVAGTMIRKGEVINNCVDNCETAVYHYKNTGVGKDFTKFGREMLEKWGDA